MADSDHPDEVDPGDAPPPASGQREDHQNAPPGVSIPGGAPDHAAPDDDLDDSDDDAQREDAGMSPL